VQLSATSQTPAALRQTKLLGRSASAGQLLPMPSHVSATSQTPAAVRHVVPAATFASAGQLGPVPSHTSCTSQTPAALRQTKAPLLLPRKASGGHWTLKPVQCSA
jgi:hypothetical protein